MNLYYVGPQRITKSMRFNLAMGSGNFLIIISNIIAIASSTIEVIAQYEGVAFCAHTQPVLSFSGVSTYIKYLREFEENNEYTSPDDFLVFVVASSEATQDIVALFNKDYFRFFILENVHPNLASLFDNYQLTTILED